MTFKCMVQKLLVVLTAGTVFVWLTSSCRQVSPELHLGQPVIVSEDFQTQSLNEQVLVSTNLSPKDLARPDLKTWIAQKTTKVSRKKDAILLGSFRRYPRAWFYTQVVNTSNTSRQLVADEFNRIRCDYFEVFTSRHGFVKSWGRIGRATPFSGYPLPFLTYAVPFTIPPKDTLTLIVHTQRHYGAHEVNLNISTYETYLSEKTVLFLSKVFESVVLVICALVMFIVGWIYRYKTMTYLSCYLLSVVYVKLNYLGFTDAFTNFTEIGLSGTNANVFALFVSCIAFHPFWMEWMKAVPKNEKVFVLISYAMMGFSLFCVCCYLLPIRLFNTVYAVIDLSLLMLIACLLTLLWMFYCSLTALLRAKIYYMFIVIIVIFLPWLLQQLSSILDKSPHILTYISPLTFIVTPVGLSITSAFLLRQQLISRRKHEANLNHIKESLEEIRKTEIETIGRNLHDNVGNMLASLQGYLSLKNQNPEVIKNLVSESMNEVRFLSHNLVKQDNQPIAEKLEMLVSRFTDFSTVRLYFNDFSGGKINQMELSRQENLYMMIQEILTNIVKHSKATEAHIQVSGNEKSLQITIEDDGIGIHPENQKEGIGLKNIYKRAELSAFKITLDSNPTGTNYIIEIHENNNHNHR